MTYILIAEDNPDDADLLLLEINKLRLTNALTFVDEVDDAKRYIHTESPALLILDLKLAAGQDGLDILRYIRGSAKTEAVPTIVLTNSREEADKIDSYRLGRNCYLQKPISRYRLLDAILFLEIPFHLGVPQIEHE